MSWSPLHEAASAGNMAEVKQLVESGAILGHQDGNGMTPIMCAIQCEQQQVSEYLAQVMSAESLSLTNNRSYNVLHWMAEYGRSWLTVWIVVCSKCPDLDERLTREADRPVDIVRRRQDRGRHYRDLYLLLEGKHSEFTECVTEKEVETYNLTITCVGHEGVGKTCLVTHLKKEKLPKGGPLSTNFGNFDINLLYFDPTTQERQNLETGGETEIGRQRLRHAMNEFKQQQAISATEHLPKGATPKPNLQPRGSSHTQINSGADSSKQAELREHEIFKDWLAECRHSYEEWLKNISESNSADNEKLVKKFIAQYSKKLEVTIYCTSCSGALSSTDWYRCVQCKDTNLCENCYKSGVRLDTGHEDDHNMVYMKLCCRGCGKIIMSSMMYCHMDTCDCYFCLGCHQRHTPSHIVEEFPPPYYPGTWKPVRRFDNVAKVMATIVEGESGPRGFISIYDFGGEKVFYNTHHCLLSSDMVFLLVFDVAMCLDAAREKAGYGRIEFWLGSIATYAADEAQNRGPPILLIGSHLDEIPGTEEEKLHRFEEVIQKLKNNPRMRSIIERHVHGMYAVNNMNDSSQNLELYDKIWEKIMEVAPLQSQWRMPIPARWLDLELELMTKKAQGFNLMTFEELENLNKTLIVPLKDEADIRQFLKHLQLSGSMLVCSLHSSRPYIVLNFELITQAFSSIITAPKFKTELSEGEARDWRRYQRSAIMPVQFLRKLWKREKIQDLIEKEDLIRFAMETYGLLSKPLSDADEDVDYYIVPSMLDEDRSDDTCADLVRRCTVKTSAFCIKFEREFIPPAIWDKLIASCVHRFEPLQNSGEIKSMCIQRGFACLHIDYNWKVVINCKGNVMKIALFTEDKDKTKPPDGIGVNIRTVIEYLLNQILEISHQSHLKYSAFLHSDYKFTEGDQMVKADEFLKGTNFPCHGSEGVCSLSREDYDFWFCRKDAEPPDLDTVSEPGGEDFPVELQHRQPTPAELGRVCKSIGLCYQMFFVELECDIALIEQIMDEYRHLTMRSRMTRLFIRHCNERPDIKYSHIWLAMQMHGVDNVVLLNVLDDKQQYEEIKGTPLSGADLCHTPTETELSIIADHVNNCYFNMFLELGMAVGNIEKCEMDYRCKSCLAMYEGLLREWIKTGKDISTVNRLLLAMKDCHMSWYVLSTVLACKEKKLSTVLACKEKKLSTVLACKEKKHSIVLRRKKTGCQLM